MARSGMAARQLAEARREEGDAEPVRRADAHRAGDRDGGIADNCARAQHLGFHAFGGQQKLFARAGQLGAGGAAGEKLGAQVRFPAR